MSLGVYKDTPKLSFQKVGFLSSKKKGAGGGVINYMYVE